MATVTVTRTVNISDITPEEMAILFTSMDDREQANFFAAVRPIAATWPGAGLCQQAYEIHRRLNDDGRFVIETLASHLPADTLARLAEEAAQWLPTR